MDSPDTQDVKSALVGTVSGITVSALVLYSGIMPNYETYPLFSSLSYALLQSVTAFVAMLIYDRYVYGSIDYDSPYAVNIADSDDESNDEANNEANDNDNDIELHDMNSDVSIDINDVD